MPKVSLILYFVLSAEIPGPSRWSPEGEIGNGHIDGTFKSSYTGEKSDWYVLQILLNRYP